MLWRSTYVLLCDHVICAGVAMLSCDAVAILTKTSAADLAYHHIRISKPLYMTSSKLLYSEERKRF